MRSLETCPYSAATFAEILAKIQHTVDELSLRQYSNLNMWVSCLDEEVEKKLAMRLQAGIHAWTDAITGAKKELDLSMDTDAPAQPTHKLGGEPQIQNAVHEIRITNQQMYLYPSIEEARFQIMQQLFAWQAIVTSQIRLQSTRYQVGLDKPLSQTYRNLLTKLPDGKVLENAYAAVEEKVSEVRNYVDEWLRYQSLWDLQADTLYGRLGENINLWIKCLNDIKKSRTTFDTSDTRRAYGSIVIDYAKVQAKVTLKYDSWHKEALGKFGTLLGIEMTTFHTKVSKSRTDLEVQSIGTYVMIIVYIKVIESNNTSFLYFLEAASTTDAVGFITYVQSLKKEMLVWDKQVEIFREAQRILERQRFQFPNNWLHVDNIEGEWSAFNEIIKRKDTAIQTQVASLQAKIISEDKAVETRTSDFLNDWERNKPTGGKIRPDDALQQLQIFEGKYTRLKEERDNVAKAKEALSLQESAIPNNSSERMNVALEELHDLRGVWSELSKVWSQIDETR